jgi:hypothetical protein
MKQLDAILGAVVSAVAYIRDRFVNVLYAWDCALFTTLTLGVAFQGESFSSAAHRGTKLGKLYGKLEKPIDAVWYALFRQTNHCKWAYDKARVNNLPEDMR